MSGVEAVNFEEVECGKKVAESKKRFKWKFIINGTSYLLELANSTLSGKRIVTLNSIQIYSEKSILNINFDFTHSIEGHTIRVSRVADNINKFQMRIDNREFEDILNHKHTGQKVEKNKYKKVENDPFSEFGNFVTKGDPTNIKNNDFGDFDFDSFATAPKPANQPQSVASKPVSSTNFDPFGFDNKPKAPNATNYQTVNFQTNTFQTNSYGSFENNFTKNDLLDEDDFATNTFNKNNLYNDLMFQKPEEKSDTWSEFPPKKEEQDKEQGYFASKISSLKIQMSAKQAVNKIKKTAEQFKKKIVGQDDSLI